MRIAIVGSRDFPNLAGVRMYVRNLPSGSVVVSGGARGVDRVSVEEAKKHGIPTTVIPAEWEKYGRSAGFRRNKDIVASADKVVAFWDGQSKGTAHTISLAREAGKPVEVITCPTSSKPRENS